MPRSPLFFFVLVVSAIPIACAPEWRDDPALVSEHRIIAVAADPPEATEGMKVTLTAFVATPGGPAAVPISWSLCDRRKPLGENGPVHPACATEPLPLLGPPAPMADAVIPSNACNLFGPETPPVTSTDPLARPSDPDDTGGFYQPIRASGVGRVAIASVRITCNLATAPLEVAADLRQRYRRNENPSPPEITALVDGIEVPLDALPRDRDVSLVASWPATSAERYLAFDAISQTVIERREAMRVAWFVSAGSVANHRLGLAESDSATAVFTTWHPATAASLSEPAGPWHLWAVLQDSRGGTAVSYRLAGRATALPKSIRR